MKEGNGVVQETAVEVQIEPKNQVEKDLHQGKEKEENHHQIQILMNLVAQVNHFLHQELIT